LFVKRVNRMDSSLEKERKTLSRGRLSYICLRSSYRVPQNFMAETCQIILRVRTIGKKISECVNEALKKTQLRDEDDSFLFFFFLKTPIIFLRNANLMQLTLKIRGKIVWRSYVAKFYLLGKLRKRNYIERESIRDRN
jgi:hypothetical protein